MTLPKMVLTVVVVLLAASKAVVAVTAKVSNEILRIVWSPAGLGWRGFFYGRSNEVVASPVMLA
jgi:hypothetical protein